MTTKNSKELFDKAKNYIPGGVDEGGGFVGDIRVYFGGDGNTHDSWMVQQMSLDTVQEEVRGLTPLYTPYMSVVVPQAYIGKQSNIPSMWFEIVNYPDALAIMYADKLKEDYETETTTSAPNALQRIGLTFTT